MKAIVYCEGSTERDFVNRILGPYLSKRGIHVCPVVCTTSNRGGIAHKGGVSTYGMISKELKRICGRTNAYVVTTMFDLYGFPPDVPNCKDPKTSLRSKKRFPETSPTGNSSLTSPNMNSKRCCSLM